VATALLGVPLLIRFALLVTASPRALRPVVDFIFDDGYYYLGIAANVAQTGHSTLDGLTATNGYQPLWLLILSGCAKLVGTRPWTLFVASCALIYSLAVAGPLVAIAWLKSSWRRVVLAFAAALAVIIIQQPELFLEGLEPVLLLPLAVPLIVLLESPLDRRQLQLLSLILAIAFLVRLDALALFVSASIVLPPGASRPAPGAGWLSRSLRVALRLSTFVVPTVLAYLAINQWLFGSAVPVSGIAKMIGGPKFSNWGVAFEFFSRWKSFLFLLAVLLPLEWLARRAARADRVFYRSFCVVSLAALIQCFYYGALSTWSIWPWYSYLVALDMAIVAARILYVSASLCELPQWRYAAWAGIAILGSWTVYRSGLFVVRSMPTPLHATDRKSFNVVSLEMLDEFFKERPHAVVAMGDRAGGLAYWGSTKVSLVQTEGLTLDAAYLRARTENRGAEYLETRYPIEYLIVDREFIPTVTDGHGASLFVIPDPIQGRITTGPVPTFCFPPGAVRYKKAYLGQFGTNTRIAFSFPDRSPCPPEALALVTAAATGVGLRKYSLPSEY
jgi:hypothetical protein